MPKECAVCKKNAIVAARIIRGEQIASVYLCENCAKRVGQRFPVEIVASGTQSLPKGMMLLPPNLSQSQGAGTSTLQYNLSPETKPAPTRPRDSGDQTKSTICSRCGTPLPSGIKFCPECGQSITLSQDRGNPAKTTYTQEHAVDTKERINPPQSSNRNNYSTEDKPLYTNTSSHDNKKVKKKKGWKSVFISLLVLAVLVPVAYISIKYIVPIISDKTPSANNADITSPSEGNGNTSSTPTSVNSIDFSLDEGNIKYVKYEVANPQLTDSDNALVFVFEFTNFEENAHTVHDIFRIKYFQNGVEMGEPDMISSQGGDQYELCFSSYNEVLKNGTVTFGDIVIPKDSSPITIMVSRNGADSDKEFQKMEVKIPQASSTVKTTEAVPEEHTVVKKTEHMDIKGLCVDKSYKDKNGSPLKLVYLFYNLTATDENLKIDSKYTKLTINNKNTYESDHYASTASAIEYMPNYYYSSYIEDVYLGSSLLVAATFFIPEAELEKGRSITISDSQIPGCDSIYFYTDDIQYFNDGESIAKAIDPNGHKQIMKSFEDADSQKTKQVMNLINGYYWWCYVNTIQYEVEFWEYNNFEVRTSLGTSRTGTYSVKNGYIFCTYTDNGSTIKIPYSIVNGDVEMDVSAAFDVMD